MFMCVCVCVCIPVSLSLLSLSLSVSVCALPEALVAPYQSTTELCQAVHAPCGVVAAMVAEEDVVEAACVGGWVGVCE